MLKLVTVVNLDEEWRARLREVAPDLEIRYVPSGDEDVLMNELADAEIVYGVADRSLGA